LLCSSVKLKPLEGYEKFHLVKCGSCSFVFASAIPTQEELIAHYNTYTRGAGISAITIQRYHDLLDSFEKYRKNGNLLDIGCGDGYFLEVAKQRGWTVYGTEYTDEAVSLCRGKGIIIHQGPLNPDNYTIQFDVITSFEVIEHINNPQHEISAISKILRVSGLFYFTTPNFNSISRTILKDKWTVISYPEHLSYYSPASMNSFLKRSGFNKISLRSTGFSIERFRNRRAAVETKQQFSQEAFREKIEGSKFLNFAKSSMNFILSATGKGDTLKGYYTKK
jgi:2-polyprenyl-3-methyl-5-hydroxy-6-metoxy-1,4-benzoquinol methylase